MLMASLMTRLFVPRRTTSCSCIEDVGLSLTVSTINTPKSFVEPLVPTVIQRVLHAFTAPLQVGMVGFTVFDNVREPLASATFRSTNGAWIAVPTLWANWLVAVTET